MVRSPRKSGEDHLRVREVAPARGLRGLNKTLCETPRDSKPIGVKQTEAQGRRSPSPRRCPSGWPRPAFRGMSPDRPTVEGGGPCSWTQSAREPLPNTRSGLLLPHERSGQVVARGPPNRLRGSSLILAFDVGIDPRSGPKAVRRLYLHERVRQMSTLSSGSLRGRTSN